MPHDFSKVASFLIKRSDKYTTALERKQLYPDKEELELTYLVLKELEQQLKQKQPKKIKVNLFGKIIPLDRSEQEKLYEIVRQFVGPYRILVESFGLVEESIARSMQLQIYYGFVDRDNRLIPRETATFIFPLQERYFTYQLDKDKVETASPLLSLEDIIKQAREKNEPLFEGGQAQDLIYVHCSEELPLKSTLIPIALKLYQQLITKSK